MLKSLLSRLPLRYQQNLKRLQHGIQLRLGTFHTNEPEYARLAEWVRPGDTVLDLGANIGHYTARLSELVGENGRVIAFEPMRESFELLATNIARLPHHNVTLINAAASDSTQTLGMTLPRFDTGLDNYYQARIDDSGGVDQILSLAVDSLALRERVTLAKVDVEGHELKALGGMSELLARDHPTLIVEGHDDEVAALLTQHGYTHEHRAGSSNRVYSRS